jgi:hypothetical protein
MAVEDGAVLGILLGGFSKLGRGENIPGILHLYVDISKKRITMIVKGVEDIVYLFRMSDPAELKHQNRDLANTDLHVPNSTIKWKWANLGYQKHLLRFDIIAVVQQKFAGWSKQRHRRQDHAGM